MSVPGVEFRIIFEKMELGAYLQGADGSMIDVNQAALAIHGTTREQFLTDPPQNRGWRLADESGQELPQELQPASVALNAGEVRDLVAAIHAEGRDEPVWANINAIQVPAAGSAPVALVTLKDISEQKRLEQLVRTREEEQERENLQLQLFHSQKLESLGVLAGGVAHDFNNLLTSIMGNTELALMQLAPGTPACDNLRRVEKATRRAADLVKQMLTYSGKGKLTTELIDVNRLVEEMVYMLEAAVSKKATLRLDLTRPLGLVRADAVQLRQVVMNLVLNASEALGDEVGKIRISTALAYYEEEDLKEFSVGHGLAAGFYVSLAVKDTGWGIDKASQEKIFDPFFSHTATGRGLGVAAVLGIARGHQGGIKLQSEMGKGSTFTVLLPANEDVLAASQPLEPAREPMGKGAVLLVDDEEEVCELAGKMLGMLGYEVITARDGHEALEVYLQRDDFAFVVLDLTMPVMNGEQTYEQLRDIDPSVKVFIISGYSDHEVASRFEGKGVQGVLQKPFDMAALRKVIG